MGSNRSELRTVRLSQIKANPHRQLGSYPIDEGKVEALRRSIGQVGFWEGVIVRPAGNGYECAFGHHRLAAARAELGEDAEITVIVRELDSGQMLQFMGRENAEDQRTNFLAMLETWESAVRHLSNGFGRDPDATRDVAPFLGWTTKLGPKSKRSGALQLTSTAYACNAAHKLLRSGRVERALFNGLTVMEARDVAQTLNTELTILDTKPNRKAADAIAVRLISAAEAVTHDIRANGGVSFPKEHVRAQIIGRAYKKDRLPAFVVVMKAMRTQVKGWHDDAVATKLKELCAVAGAIDPHEMAEYRYLRLELEKAAKRCQTSVDLIDHAMETRVPESADQPLLLTGGTNEQPR